MPKSNSIEINRADLYEKIWMEGITRTAKEYGTDTETLKKVCMSADIPTPTLKYWANLQCGKDVKREVLSDSEETIVIIPIKSRIIKHSSGSSYYNKIRKEKEKAEAISENIKEPGSISDNEWDNLNKAIWEESKQKRKSHHPSTLQYIEKTNQWEKTHTKDEIVTRDKYHTFEKGEPRFWLYVSDKSQKRLIDLLDSIYSITERLGGSVIDEYSVSVFGQSVQFDIYECKSKQSHVITKDEQKQLDKYNADLEASKKKKAYGYYSSYVYEPKIRKYDYQFNGKLVFMIRFGDCSVRDNSDVKLENQLYEIFFLIYKDAEKSRIQELKEQEAERIRLEKEARAEAERKQWNNELDEYQKLLALADDYDIAMKIRRYIELSREKGFHNEAWNQWASEKADWLDPGVKRTDQIFGNRVPGEELEKKISPDEEKNNSKVNLWQGMDYYLGNRGNFWR